MIHADHTYDKSLWAFAEKWINHVGPNHIESDVQIYDRIIVGLDGESTQRVKIWAAPPWLTSDVPTLLSITEITMEQPTQRYETPSKRHAC